MKRQLGILVLMAVLMAGTIYGACTFVNPTASDILKGSEVLNVSCAAADDATNCTLTPTSATSGSSAATIHLYNNSDAGLNATYITTSLRDAGDYIFAGNCVNSSSQSYTITSVTGVTIDNTLPGCVHSASSRTDYKPDRIWTVTGTNATSSTLQFGSQPAVTMAENSDVFTYTTTRSSLPEGTYNKVKAITNDGLNTTTCTLDYVTIDTRARAEQIVISSVIGQKQAEAEPIVVQTSNNNNAVGIVILVAIAGFWWLKRKK